MALTERPLVAGQDDALASAAGQAPGTAPRARPERRVAINSGLLLAAYGFQSLISLVIVGLVARYLGQAGLGRYAYVISFIELVIAFIDLGMSRIEVREISRHLATAGRYSSAVFTLRLLFTLAGMVAVGVIAGQSGDQELWLAIMVYYAAQTLYLLGDVYSSVFHGFQRMEYQFWGLSISQVFLLLFTVGVIWLNAGLVALFAARLAANAIKVVFVWWFAERRFAKTRFLWSVIPGAILGLRNLSAATRLRLLGQRAGQASVDGAAAQSRPEAQASSRWEDARLTWRMLVDSAPVGFSLVLRSYIWRGGIVLAVLWLGQEQGDMVNGVLYGPLRVIQQMRIIPAAIAGAMLPVFSNRAVDRLDEFDAAFAKSVKLFTAISLVLTMAFAFLADPTVTLLLGDSVDLQGAAQVLVVLGAVVALYFLNWLYGVTLVALGRQRLEAIGLAIGLVVGLAVAYASIRPLGALGISLSILSAEGVFFVIGTVAMWPHFHWQRLAPALSKIFLACAASGLVFAGGHLLWTRFFASPPGSTAAGSSLNALVELVVVGASGLAACAAMLLLLRTFDADEMTGIKAMVPKLRRGRA